jgi:hypothetical protein
MNESQVQIDALLTPLLHALAAALARGQRSVTDSSSAAWKER